MKKRIASAKYCFRLTCADGGRSSVFFRPVVALFMLARDRYARHASRAVCSLLMRGPLPGMIPARGRLGYNGGGQWVKHIAFLCRKGVPFLAAGPDFELAGPDAVRGGLLPDLCEATTQHVAYHVSP
ncbi:unnamed protein product [Amoebophrya sp. A120]|nr:unnamed protein product [Amoebophrya sp. A120]|eukprot:GSA120T00014315001.1